MNNHKSNLRCPYCDGSRSFAIREDHEHCYKCGHHYFYNRDIKLFDKKSQHVSYNLDDDNILKSVNKNFTENYYNYLLNFFDETTIKDDKFPVFYSNYLDKLVFKIAYKNEIKAYQARSIYAEPKWVTYSKSYSWGNKWPYMSTEAQQKTNKFIVLCEDIISGLKIAKVQPAIAMLGTQYNQELMNFIMQHGNNFILWFDNDEAGLNAYEKYLNKLQHCANIKTIESKYDPKYYSTEKIQEMLK